MNKLKEYRKTLDKIDKKLIHILTERFLVVKKISHYKKKQGLSSLDKTRFSNILKTRISWGKKFKLPPDLVKELFTLIHNFSLRTMI